MAILSSTVVQGNLNTIGTLSEGGTLLSAKYLGKTAKAADSDKLDNHDSSYFQVALPTTNTAGQVLKSTSTAGTVEWGNLSVVIRNSGDTADVTNLSANTSYKLKIGNSTCDFKTPADNNSTTYLSYTATATQNASTATNYILGKQTVSANNDNYYNTGIFFKGNTLYSNSKQVTTTSKYSDDSNHYLAANIIVLSQSEYDGLSSKDSNTVYLIKA